MVDETHVRVGGSWQQVSEAFVKVGGAWKDVTFAHSRVAAVWQTVFTREVVTVTSRNYQFVNPNDAKAGVEFLSSGAKQKVEGVASAVYVVDDASTDWVKPSKTATYHIKATLTGGSNPDTGTMNTWQALTSNRRWENVQAGEGLKTSTIVISISNDGGATTLDAGTFVLEADGLP